MARVILAGSLLLLTLSLFAEAAKQETKVTCADVEALLAKKDVAEARDAHTQLRLDDPGQPCVAAVAAKLDAVRKEAKIWFDSGQKLETTKAGIARLRYAYAAKVDPTYTEAHIALARLGTPVDDAFANAKRLSQLGLHADALTALKEAVAKTHEPIPEELQYLSGGRLAWWRPIIRELEPYARPIGEVLAVLAIPLALIGALFVRAVKPPKLEIAEFNDDNADVKVARSLTALLRDRIKYFSANLLPRLGFIDGPSQLVALPAAISAALPNSAGWINWLPSLLNLVNPRRVLTVSGTLHPSGENGAGMTITLREGNEVLYTSTLWQRDFDPNVSVAASQQKDPSGYHELTEPAAIWLLFRLSGGVR